MGTNYYVKKKDGSHKDTIHIGKSSAGWKFLFQSAPAYENYFNKTNLNTFEVWKDFLEKYVGYSKYGKKAIIIDEYDKRIYLKEFLNMIDEKQLEPNVGNSELRNGYRFSDDIFW